MAEKIVIAELDINTQALIAAAAKTKKAIDGIREANKKLKKSNEDQTEQLVKNEVALKKLSTQYLEQKKAIIALESPYKKLSRELTVSRNKAKDLAVEFGVNSRQARAAAREVNKLDARLKKIDKSLGQSQRNVGNYGGSLKNLALRFVGLSTVIFGAIRAFRDMFNRVRAFDKAMVGLSAILGVNREELAGLEQEIKNVAGASIKTSNEVAELATTLVTLGKTKQEVIQLLKPVNDLSIALQATSQEAGELLVQTLNAFGQGSDQAERFADIIAKMRTSTALDFERIKDALGFLAPTARAAGVSFERTGALLGVLVDNGIKASRAGRLTSTAFLRLASSGLTLNDALDQINDAQERGVKETELLTIAGKLFGKEAAAIGLILADTRDKQADLTEEFENAQGTLKELTDKQLESLDAKLKILDSTWEKFILNIENGEGAISGVFKDAIDVLTRYIGLVDLASEASDGLFGFVFKFNKAVITGDVQSLANEVAKKRFDKEKLELKNQLLKLLNDEAKINEVAIDSQKQLEQINKLTFNQIKARIILIEQERKAEEDAEKDAIDRKKVLSEEEKKAKVKREKEEDKRRKAQEKKEIEDLATFEQQKIDVKNEIEIAQAESDEEKAVLKSEQKLEKDLLELEELEITENQKNELEQLLLTNHELELQAIRDNAAIEKEQQALKVAQKEEKLKAKFAKSELKAASTLEKAKASVRNAGLSVLKGILGDSLAARILDVALQAKTDIAQVKIETAAAQARNLAQATATLPPPANLPLIAAAKVQNTGIGITSKLAQGKILLASAISAAASAFYEGGQVPQGTGGVISGSNIPTQKGGDNILATVKSGEVILNEQQQARAGGSTFFKSIGVPGFQGGGVSGINTSVPNLQPTQQMNIEAFSDSISDKINDIKIVAIEQEITNQQNAQVEIVNAANI